jgi:hypothetical protein
MIPNFMAVNLILGWIYLRLLGAVGTAPDIMGPLPSGLVTGITGTAGAGGRTGTAGRTGAGGGGLIVVTAGIGILFDV